MSTTAKVPTDIVSELRKRCREVIAPDGPEWDAARSAWVANVDQHPVAVVYPSDADEVAAAIAVAKSSGRFIAVQGTGHGATTVGELEDAILIRTSRLRDVDIDPVARTARVGAGVEWVDVTAPAGRHGLVALHGSSPNVGVAGFVLGGGIGWLARSHGLACNSVTAIELVTMDGERIRTDAMREPDLFWALRGGGGFFGVVTAIELELFPLESVHAGWLIWPWEHSAEVLRAWSEWTREVPEALTSVGRILQVPDIPIAPEAIRGKALVVVEVAFAGGEERGSELVEPLRALEPKIDTLAQIPAADLVTLHQDPEDPVPFVSGHAMMSDLPARGVDALVDVVGPGSGSRLLSTEIRHLGGAAGRPVPGAGALSHIVDEYALLAIGIPMDPSETSTLAAEAARAAAAMSPFGRGLLYSNFADRRAHGALFYPPADLQRLEAIQERFDPMVTLRANHDLTPTARGAEQVV